MQTYSQFKHITINLPEDAVVGVIGDIHEHEKQFDEIVELFQPSKNRILISVGDIVDKGFGYNIAKSIMKKLEDMQNDGISYTVLGNHESKYLKKAIRSEKKLTQELKWLESLPYSISFKYPNGKTLLVLHGGITPKHTVKNLNSPEIMYVRTVDSEQNMIPLKLKTINGKTVISATKSGIIWHELYDGRFGYICSGHDAQKDGKPKYYKYSCNIDTACYITGVLTCQLFNNKGLDSTIHAYGPAYGG